MLYPKPLQNEAMLITHIFLEVNNPLQGIFQKDKIWNKLYQVNFSL